MTQPPASNTKGSQLAAETGHQNHSTVLQYRCKATLCDGPTICLENCATIKCHTILWQQEQLCQHSLLTPDHHHQSDEAIEVEGVLYTVSQIKDNTHVLYITLTLDSRGRK